MGKMAFELNDAAEAEFGVYSDQLIIIFAIMHMKRKPDYWEKRIK